LKQLRLRNVPVVLVALCACASWGVSLASAQTAAPKPATAVPYNCVTLVPATRLAALTGGTFTLARSSSVAPQGASFCGYNGWAQPPVDGALVGNAQTTDSTLSIFSGKTAAGKALVAKEWKIYSHPPADGKYCRAPVEGSTAPALDPRDCQATPLAGLGDQAVEFNDYIVVQKGSTLFQLWAGNNGGHHMSYDQLDTVARYLLTKIK
jgi:hypothetical protein